MAPSAAGGGLRVVGFADLSTEDFDCWHSLRQSNPALDSPYFHPAFASAVHAVTGDVRVAIAAGPTGATGGLLPFRVDGRLARPAGWPAVDFQSPISAPGTVFDPTALLREAKVGGFAFDHLLADSPGFDEWIEVRRPSPFLDVTGGVDGYLGRASSSGKQNLGQARRRLRKAERDIGPVRFVAESTDPELLDAVIELKRGQYEATGARDYFAVPGRRELLHRLLSTRDGSFGGILSGVYAGDRLLAAHFGLRDGKILHWWFPVYDPEFAQLAPGWILLRELIDASPELGFARIDLGRGEDEYKRRAKTGEVVVCEGTVEAGGLGRRVRAARRRLIAGVKSSKFGPDIVRVAKRVLRRSG